MIPRNYYCLIAGLPDLVFDQNKLSITILDFKKELKDVLHPDDYRLVELLFLIYDNKNLLNLLFKEKKVHSPFGKYTSDELEDALKEPDILEPYMARFIDEYKEAGDTQEQASWERKLSEYYTLFVMEESNAFLNDWFEYNNMLKNILVAYNCRKYDIPVDKELVGEGDLIDALRKSRSRDFGLSSEIDYIEKLLSILENKNLLDREKNLDLMRWNYLDELTTFKYFTIEVVLAFVIRLFTLDRWIYLDKSRGEELFNRYLERLKMSYSFPKEFKI